MALCMVETIYDAPRTRLIRHSSGKTKTKNKKQNPHSTELRPQLRWGAESEDGLAAAEGRRKLWGCGSSVVPVLSLLLLFWLSFSMSHTYI